MKFSRSDPLSHGLLLLYFSLGQLLYVQPEPKLTTIVQGHLEAARQAEQANNYAQAAQEYTKILALVPQSPDVYQKLGLVYHLQSKYQEAIAAFGKSLALQPNSWSASLFLGIDYYKTNQFSQAIPALRKALEINPREAEFEARFWLGASHAALAHYRAAAREFEILVRLAPRNMEVLYNLSQAHQKYSAELFDRILRAEPDSHRVYQLQGESYQSANRLEEAVEEYKGALARRPNLEGVHLEIAKIYRQLGDNRRAAAEYEYELRLNPYDAEAQHGLDLARRESGEPSSPRDSSVSGSKMAEDLTLQGIGSFNRSRRKEAVETFERALEQNPGDTRARIYLARSLAGLGQSEKASSILEAMLKKAGSKADVLYALGKIHSEAASANLNKMIEIEPNSYRVHQMVGERHEKDEEYPKALESYKTAFALKPDLPGIRFSIGSIHWKIRQFDEAIRWLQEELASNPHHALAHFQLGNIHVYRGQAAVALPHLQEAVLANPGFMEARRELGKALMQLQQYEKAAEQFNLVARADPEDDAIHALLANLYRKQGRLADAEAEMQLVRRLNQKRLERAQTKPEKPR